jgi:serine/threonine protein kinase
VASAAAFAHSRGVVHRDIKPKNILVDEAGEPRLIDFGMARLRTAWSDDRKESDGGTFAFMAPEQARMESEGDRQKVGPRSDVFALGAVLYFLLTSRAPFSGRTWTEAWDRARRCAYDGAALEERPRETLHSPEALDGGLKMKGPRGLETVLLLVRRTPLPPDIDLASALEPCLRHPCATSSRSPCGAVTRASRSRRSRWHSTWASTRTRQSSSTTRSCN